MSQESGKAPDSVKVVRLAEDYIDIWLSNEKEYFALNWRNDEPVGQYDYVALFDHYPTDPKGYLFQQWCYVTNQSPYTTGTKYVENNDSKKYYIAYGSYDYATSRYKILCVSLARGDSGGGHEVLNVNDQYIEIGVSNNGGKATLNWLNPKSVGKEDYVALCEGDPTSPTDYIGRNYQWASKGSSWVTWQEYDPSKHWIMYCSKDYTDGKEHVIKKQEPMLSGSQTFRQKLPTQPNNLHPHISFIWRAAWFITHDILVAWPGPTPEGLANTMGELADAAPLVVEAWMNELQAVWNDVLEIANLGRGIRIEQLADGGLGVMPWPH